MCIRVVPGRHIRRAELEVVRRVSLAALIMLVVQYGLGIILNLYIAVPASDAHAGLMQEIASGPLMLTVHALLGLGLIGAALVLLVRAVRLGDQAIAVLAAPATRSPGWRSGSRSPRCTMTPTSQPGLLPAPEPPRVPWTMQPSRCSC
jgi:hypothetical protein